MPNSELITENDLIIPSDGIKESLSYDELGIDFSCESLYKNNFFTDDLIYKYFSKLSWKHLLTYQDVPEICLEKYNSFLDWDLVAENQDITDRFYKKYHLKLNRILLLKNNKLKFNVIKENLKAFKRFISNNSEKIEIKNPIIKDNLNFILNKSRENIHISDFFHYFNNENIDWDFISENILLSKADFYYLSNNNFFNFNIKILSDRYSEILKSIDLKNKIKENLLNQELNKVKLPCFNKKSFSTLAQAEKIRSSYSKLKELEFRIYKCNYCNFLHLTKKPLNNFDI